MCGVSTVTDGMTLINTPSTGAETSRLLTVRLLKVGHLRKRILFAFVTRQCWRSQLCNNRLMPFVNLYCYIILLLSTCQSLNVIELIMHGKQ